MHTHRLIAPKDYPTVSELAKLYYNKGRNSWKGCTRHRLLLCEGLGKPKVRRGKNAGRVLMFLDLLKTA